MLMLYRATLAAIPALLLVASLGQSSDQPTQSAAATTPTFSTGFVAPLSDTFGKIGDVMGCLTSSDSNNHEQCVLERLAVPDGLAAALVDGGVRTPQDASGTAKSIQTPGFLPHF